MTDTQIIDCIQSNLLSHIVIGEDRSDWWSGGDGSHSETFREYATRKFSESRSTDIGVTCDRREQMGATTQTQYDRLNAALSSLNEQMRGHSEYEIVTSTRGCMSLYITSSESGRGKRVLYLGSDIERATADIEAITEWEESK